MNEDQHIAREQERHEKERAAQQRLDDIAAATADIVIEAKHIRVLEKAGTAYDDLRAKAIAHLSTITDRLNELEGDTA